jgi:hypothetical protein
VDYCLDFVIHFLYISVSASKYSNVSKQSRVWFLIFERGVHRVLVGKPEGKRPLGRPRRRWAGNIKLDVKEVGGGRGDLMELAQDCDRWRALVSTVKNLRVP